MRCPFTTRARLVVRDRSRRPYPPFHEPSTYPHLQPGNELALDEAQEALLELQHDVSVAFGGLSASRGKPEISPGGLAKLGHGVLAVREELQKQVQGTEGAFRGGV